MKIYPCKLNHTFQTRALGYFPWWRVLFNFSPMKGSLKIIDWAGNGSHLCLWIRIALRFLLFTKVKAHKYTLQPLLGRQDTYVPSRLEIRGQRFIMPAFAPYRMFFFFLRNRNTVKLYFLHWLTYFSKSAFDDWQIRGKLESELINNNTLVLL